MAKMQAKIQVWQAKINLNCQTKNKMAGEIYWTGVVSFSSPLTMFVYLLILSMNQSSLMKKILLKNSFNCKTLHKTNEVTHNITHKVTHACVCRHIGLRFSRVVWALWAGWQRDWVNFIEPAQSSGQQQEMLKATWRHPWTPNQIERLRNLHF